MDAKYLAVLTALLIVGSLVVAAWSLPRLASELLQLQFGASDQTLLRVTVVSVDACANGLDDDGDGLIDHPDDPGCDSPSDNDETDEPAGDDDDGGGGGGGSGGGGGGGDDDDEIALPSGAVLAGYAYPDASVVVLLGGEELGTYAADEDGEFEIELADLEPGQRTLGLWARDAAQLRSRTYSFTVSIDEQSTTIVSDIVLAPTVRLDKEAVRRGDPLIVSGSALADARVAIEYGGAAAGEVETRADSRGRYSRAIETLGLPFGAYEVVVQAHDPPLSSQVSAPHNVRIGDENREAPRGCAQRADLNGDCRVDLVDFSIAAFWWERPLTDEARERVDAKLWEDGVINLRDFSILAYHWSG